MCVAAVHVKDGRIAEVKPVNGKASQANLTHAAQLTFGLKHILDYGDLIVAPGLIDTHVHMDQPGRTDWEGESMCQLPSACAVLSCGCIRFHDGRSSWVFHLAEPGAVCTAPAPSACMLPHWTSRRCCRLDEHVCCEDITV